ncbi:MAG: HEAT repeat domain-containing protein [Coraliomargaritaceae bacterium]
MCRYSFILAVLFTVAHASAIDVDSTVQALASDDYDERTKARNDLRLGFADAEGVAYKEFEQSVLEYAQKKDGSLPLEERLYLLKLVGLFGTEASVKPVANLLGHENAKVRDSARRALSNISSDSASSALAIGLRNASGEEKSFYLDALAYRGDPRAVALIAAELESDNPDWVRRAAMALGKLGSAEAIPALLDALENGVEPIAEIEIALLRSGLNSSLAQKLVEEGSQNAVCVDAFRQLQEQDSRLAGVVFARLLKDPTARARSMIISEVWSLDAPNLQSQLIDYLPTATLADKILIITGVGESGSSEYEKDLLALYPLEDNWLLKQSMLSTLGSVGGDASFETLYKAFQADTNNRGVSDALARLQAPSADATAMKQVRTADTVDEQISAIRVLELRNVPGATELINSIAQSDKDKKLRQAAFTALESIGDFTSIELLIDLIISEDPMIRPAQRSLKRLSLNFLAPGFLWKQYYLPAITEAQTDEQRIGIIMILDGVDSWESMDYIKTLVLDSQNEALSQAAMKTLSRWSSVRSVETWMELVEKDASYREDAIKAIHRAATSDSVQDGPTRKVEALVKAIQSTDDAVLKNDLLQVYLDPPSKIIWAIKSRLTPLKEDPDVAELAQEILDKFTD